MIKRVIKRGAESLQPAGEAALQEAFTTGDTRKLEAATKIARTFTDLDKQLATIYNVTGLADIPLPTPDEQTNEYFQQKAKEYQTEPPKFIGALQIMYTESLVAVALLDARHRLAVENSDITGAQRALAYIKPLAQSWETIRQTFESPDLKATLDLLEQKAKQQPAPSGKSDTSRNIIRELFETISHSESQSPTRRLASTTPRPQEVPVTNVIDLQGTRLNLTTASLGEILRRYRLSNNLTQAEVARLLGEEGSSVSYVSAIERDQINPGSGKLQQFVQALHIPEDVANAMYRKMSDAELRRKSQKKRK